MDARVLAYVGTLVLVSVLVLILAPILGTALFPTWAGGGLLFVVIFAMLFLGIAGLARFGLPGIIGYGVIGVLIIAGIVFLNLDGVGIYLFSYVAALLATFELVGA